MKFAFRPEIEFNPLLSSRSDGLMCVPLSWGCLLLLTLSVVIYHGQYRAKMNLLICSLLPYESVLEMKTWHFVPSSILYACFLSLGQNLGQPASFCPSTVGRVILRENGLTLIIKEQEPQSPAFVTSKKSICRWTHLGGGGSGAHEAAPSSCSSSQLLLPVR